MTYTAVITREVLEWESGVAATELSVTFVKRWSFDPRAGHSEATAKRGA
jgi:hypothetical protein